MGVGGGRRPFFHAQEAQERPTTAAARRARHTTNRIQKPPENRVKTAIPGVICKEGAARRRPGSHSSRPKRTSFAALEDSIADGAANGKGVRRANEALERANFARKTETSAQIGADWGVRGPCEACVASAQNRGKPGRVQSDIPGKTSKPCHFAVFPGFSGVRAPNTPYIPK